MRTIIIIIAAALVAAAGSALAEPPQTRTFYNEKGAGGRPGDDVPRRDDLPEREGTNYWARGAPRQHDQLLQREGSMIGSSRGR
jgi:hypothetical protein